MRETADRTWAAVERARAEAALAVELADAQQLQAVSSRLIEEDDAEALYGQLLEAARAIMRSDMATVQMLVPERNELLLLAAINVPPESTKHWERVKLDSATTCGQAMTAGRRVVVPDVELDANAVGTADLAHYRLSGIRAVQSTPLVSRDGHFVGMISTHWRTVHRPGERELNLLNVLARQTADLIERRQSEDALRASEGRLRAVAENLPHGAAFVVDHDLRYTLAGGQALGPAGLSPADLEGKTVAEVLPPEAAAGNAANYRRALAGETFRAEHAAHGRHYVTHGVPLRDAAGDVTAALAVSYDITDRVRAEEALRLAEERLRLALAAARMGIWTLDAATGSHTRDANLNLMLGLAPVETTRPFDEFLAHVHPADRPAVDAAFAASIAAGHPLNTEFRIVRPDGGVRWLRDQGDVFGDAAAGRRHMAGACVDVTDRAVAEAAVRASEERLQQIVTSATDYAIFTLDDGGRITGWSPGATSTFGYDADEVVGRSVDSLFTPEDRAAAAPAAELGTALRDGRASDERWHVRKDGSRFFASGVLNRLAAGGFVKVARDLTERKRMEDDLRAARDQLEQRVAERTGELAAVVDVLEAEMGRRRELALRLSSSQEDERQRVSRDLHDTVGQTHAGLSMALKAVADTLPPGGPGADRLAYARKLADDMGRELHEAAVRLRPTALDDLGLEAALRDLAAVWSRRQGVRAELYIQLGDGRPAQEIETALYRVVQEALTNVARHARATTVSVAITRSDGTIQAVVEDNGAGFDPAVAGKRLGLLGMRERLVLLGGEVQIESEPGRGTTIIARIPTRAGS